jgi:hypothetical protein
LHDLKFAVDEELDLIAENVEHGAQSDEKDSRAGCLEG